MLNGLLGWQSSVTAGLLNLSVLNGLDRLDSILEFMSLDFMLFTS